MQYNFDRFLIRNLIVTVFPIDFNGVVIFNFPDVSDCDQISIIIYSIPDHARYCFGLTVLFETHGCFTIVFNDTAVPCVFLFTYAVYSSLIRFYVIVVILSGPIILCVQCDFTNVFPRPVDHRLFLQYSDNRIHVSKRFSVVVPPDSDRVFPVHSVILYKENLPVIILFFQFV